MLSSFYSNQQFMNSLLLLLAVILISSDNNTWLHGEISHNFNKRWYGMDDIDFDRSYKYSNILSIW